MEGYSKVRIVCTSLEEFIECIISDAAVIFQSTVRCSIVRRPVGGTRDDAPKFEVVLQSSAVVRTEDYEYILEYGVPCGTDYCDSSDEMAGTEKAEEIKKKILEVVDANSLRLLPGIIDY